VHWDPSTRPAEVQEFLRADLDLLSDVVKTGMRLLDADKIGVLREIRRLAPKSQTRLTSVYSEHSIGARREWYRRLRHAVVEETDEYLATGGFEASIGDCVIRPLTGTGRAVTF
jgi:hypothetical protein